MNKKSFLVGFVAMSLLGCGVHGFLSESKSFFSAFIRSPKDVGSVIPSSRFLSNAVTRYVTCEGDPVVILELGAGTGPFTEKLVQKLRPQDRLDVIEIDPDLCKILEQKFGHLENVHIYCISMLEWNPSYRYDFVVSAIPHNTFNVDFVNSILDKYQELIKSGGIISFIELMWMGKIKKTVLRGKKKREYAKTLDTMSQFRKKFEFTRDAVLRNIPPAHAYHLRIIKEG